jgi:hypothetical protein
MRKKIHLIRALLIIFGFVLYSNCLKAQEGREKITTDTLQTKSGSISLVGYPIAFYTPETDLGVGLGGMAYFNITKPYRKRVSKIKVSAWYTRTHQYSISVTPAIYFPGTNRYYLEGELKYSKEKLKFYGIGNSTQDMNEAPYSINRNKYYIELVRRGFVLKFLKSGFVLELSKDEVYDFAQALPANNREVIGVEGGTNTGFGFVLLFDRRNNIFFPTQNGFYKVLANSYGRTLGGIFTYNNFIIDLRQYFSLPKEHVFAVQLYANFTDGNPPFYNLPALGGDKRMRGFFEGRYRDKQYITGQIEYRKIIWWRLGVAAFWSTGDVAQYIRRFKINEFKNAYGFGLRFVFDEEQRVNLRMDMGFGKNTDGVYFSLEEAF